MSEDLGLRVCKCLRRKRNVQGREEVVSGFGVKSSSETVYLDAESATDRLAATDDKSGPDKIR